MEGARGRDARVRLAAARPVVVDARAGDRRLGLRQDAAGPLPRRRHVADPPLLERLGDDGRLDLERGRRHAGHQHPVLGAADAGPAALRRPARIGEVAAPHRVRRRRLVGRHRELEVAAGLELDQHPAEEPARLLARLGLDLDDHEVEDRVHERDAGRAPVERPEAQVARLRPAADVDEDARDVAAEQVRVDRVQVHRARLGHVRERLVDRLAGTPEQLQHDRHVRAGPPPLLDQAELPGPLDRLAEQPHARLRVVAPGPDHGQGRHRVDRLGLRGLAQAARDLERLRRRPLGVAERAGDHPLLREQREDPGALDRRLARGDAGRLAQGGRRARGIAGRDPVAPEPRLEHRVRRPVAPLAERRQRALRVGDGAGRAHRRVGRLRGELADRQHRERLARQLVAVRRAARLCRLDVALAAVGEVVVAHGEGGGVDGVRIGGDHALGGLGGGQVEAQLEGLHGVLRRLHGEREPAGLERGLARLGQPVGGPPVRRGDHRDVLERRGKGGPVARPLGRQQVRDDGARHQLVADPEPLVGLRAHEAVLQRLGEPGGEVAPRGRPRRDGAATSTAAAARASAGPRSRRPPGRGGRGPSAAPRVRAAAARGGIRATGG